MSVKSKWIAARRASRRGILPQSGVYDLGLTQGGTRRIADDGAAHISIFLGALASAADRRRSGDIDGARRSIRAARQMRPTPEAIFFSAAPAEGA